MTRVEFQKWRNLCIPVRPLNNKGQFDDWCLKYKLGTFVRITAIIYLSLYFENHEKRQHEIKVGYREVH